MKKLLDNFYLLHDIPERPQIVGEGGDAHAEHI
jgi:hypothetical protein